MFINIIIIFVLSIFIAGGIINTPLNLGIWVLILALITAIIFSIIQTTWFGILLFLIYVGGILVIFAYFIAISPNQELRLIPPFTLTTIIFIIFMVNHGTNKYINITPHINMIEKPLRPLFDTTNIFILFLLAVILFVALVLVVKISIRSRGPLRPFYKYVFSNSKTPPTY